MMKSARKQEDLTKSDLMAMSVEDLLELQENIRNATKSKIMKKTSGCKNSSLNLVEDNVSNSALSEKKKVSMKKKCPPDEKPLRKKNASPLWKTAKTRLKASSRIIRDPRFDDLSGKLDMKAFQSNYKFLEDVKQRELEVLRQELQETKDPDVKARIKLALQAHENRTRERTKRAQLQEAKRMERSAALESLKQGKMPYIKKNSDSKLEFLVQQYHELKKSNKLSKYLVRKEKKKRAKELFTGINKRRIET